MNFILSAPRYISEITYSKDAPAQERFVFEAVVGSPYELIAAGHGSLRFGKVVFHRMLRSQEPNGQFSYLEPQTDAAERSEAGTFYCDMPVDEQLFDRWMTSGILNQRLSLTVSFGFMPPAGLKYDAGPDGWESQTWFVETHRHLLVTEFSLIVHPAILRSTNDSEDFPREV
jgi:hypothetical protein